jgi:FkbM family methyltransferase
MGLIKIDIAHLHKPCSVILDLDPNLPNENTILKHVTNGRFYEPDISLVFKTVLRDGDTMIDVGGNAGFFTVLGASLVGSTGSVLTFEPDPRNIQRLKNNIRVNAFQNVTLVECPAMDEAKEATFYINSDNSGGSALWDVGEFPSSVLSRENPQTMSVEGTTIDLEVERAGLSNVRLIKVDAEGAELLALKGAAKLLEGAKVPFVIAELNEFALVRMGSNQADLRNYMCSLGYQSYMLYFDGTLPRFVPNDTLIELKFFCNILFSTAEHIGRYWPKYQHDPGSL